MLELSIGAAEFWAVRGWAVRVGAVLRVDRCGRGDRERRWDARVGGRLGMTRTMAETASLRPELELHS